VAIVSASSATAPAARFSSRCATLRKIARDAGVGIGTLYRHFPTREALVEAVYRTELGTVCAIVDDLLAVHEPAEALRVWMDRYAGFVTTKRGMADTLRGPTTARGWVACWTSWPPGVLRPE
jgi:AcrR family transcriptional regulator